MFWPEIKKFIGKYIKELLSWFEKWLKDRFTKRSNANAQEADSRAENAAQNAARTSDPNEAEKWKAIASVWREVAEKFRREKEELEGDLAAAREQAEAKADDSLRGLAFEDAFEVSADDIRAKNVPLLENKG